MCHCVECCYCKKAISQYLFVSTHTHTRKDVYYLPYIQNKVCYDKVMRHAVRTKWVEGGELPTVLYAAYSTVIPQNVSRFTFIITRLYEHIVRTPT